MQRKTTKLVSFLLLVLFLFSNQQIYGQNTGESSLVSVLKKLEERHSVSFSYVANEISEILIPPPSNEISLEDALRYLNEHTTFQFTKIDQRYISVSKKNDSNKEACGIIVDGITGLPLEGANVVVGRNSFGTVTQINGVFVIPIEFTSEEISIQHVGFTTLFISSNELSSDCRSYALQPSISQLNEIYIQRYLVRGISRNLNGSTNIKTKNFGLLPGQTENDVLQMAQVIPGVESINETISTINTRGGSNDENLILWEGNRMYQTGHFFGLISAFNPNLTQSVTIIKNGTPTIYGESVSGVFDISTSDSIASKLRGGAGINLIYANAFLELPISDKLGLQISGRGSNKDFFQTPVYKSYSQRIFQNTEITNVLNNQQSTDLMADEDFRFYDIGLKVLWDATEKDKIRFNFLAINNDLDFTETLTGMSQSKTSKLKQKSIVGGASWERVWSQKFKTQSLVYSSYYQLEALNTDIFTNQEQFQENEVLELGLKINGQINLKDHLILNSGYQFSEVGIANTQDVNLPRFRDFNKDVLRSHIIYGSLRYQSKNKKSTINGGLRANYFDKFNVTLIEPRLHLLQKITSSFALELSGEFKSQTATQRIDFESDFLGVEKRRWVLSDNDEIPIKKSRQASIGMVYHKNNWFINVEGFYKKVKGITSKSQGFQNQFQFSNTTGNYMIKGVEFILNKKINDFSGWITYSYNKNDYDFKSLSPAEFPNNIDVRHTAKVAGTYNFNDLKFAMGFNWHTGKPFTTPIAGEMFIIEDGVPVIQFNQPNEERLPDYFRLDVSAEYLWRISTAVDAKINLALLNLLDKQNTLNIRYVLEIENEDILVSRIEELSLGFTPNLSIQVLF
jgi:TonB dependent receptor-like, beta-barrel/CarboxypepD_reg-like domain/TonB-dependent Receptor Plug Domain